MVAVVPATVGAVVLGAEATVLTTAGFGLSLRCSITPTVANTMVEVPITATREETLPTMSFRAFMVNSFVCG